MGRDGAESAAAEAASVNVHTVLDHLVGRDRLPAVLRVRFTCIRQVVGRIYLFRGHRGVGGIHDCIDVVDGLQDALCMLLVGLLLDILEILCLVLLIVQAGFVRMKHNVFLLDSPGNIRFLAEVNGLRDILQVFDAHAVFQFLCYADDLLLAHAIDNHVGMGIT